MVPYPAGGVSDLLARIVNVPVSRQLGQPVIIENLGGVSGALAAQKVLSAPADGYYVFQGSPNELILSLMANAAVKFRPEEFRAIQMVAIAPLAIIARKDLPASNADEMLAYATKAASEGRPMTYGSVDYGSFYHMLGDHMSKVSGIPMTHVPYKGGAPALQDLMGGQIDILTTPFGKPQIEMAQQSRIKFLPVLSPARMESVKHVPSINEGKALKGFNFSICTGHFVRKDTPEPVVQSLYRALNESLKDQGVRAGMEAQSMEVSRPQSLEEAQRSYIDGTAQFRAIAESINLQPQ